MAKHPPPQYDRAMNRDEVIKVLAGDRDLTRTDLARVDLSDLDLSHADLSDSRLDFAWLKRTCFASCQLRRTSFRNAMLDGTTFDDAHAEWAKFAGAHIKNSSFTNANLSLCSFVRATVIQTPFDSADFYRANLAAALFQDCSFTKANFKQARAWRMWVVGCVCKGAHFRATTLRGTAFDRCDLELCNFENADCRRITISNSIYDYSALSMASLHGAEVMRSGQHVSTFICHAGEDKPFARRLSRDLRASGIEVWLDEWKIKVGDSITAKVDRALADCTFVVVILSQHLFSKPWPMRELRSALMRQASTSDAYVLPARIDDSPMPSLIEDIAYANFRNDYDAGMEQLLAGVLEEL